ncbi:MAG: hypothetical protein B7Y45_08015 [Sphingomonas sp. 28-66-16]|nr:MAG: hypothetical protein B7Y45_08015 [Sphingomonas sp. 28-66-16]
MRDASERPLKRLTRKLGAVIDITRTIDRNSDDGGHADQNGEIAYVFDTNVIQMFLEPYKNPRFAQVFHAPLWEGDSQADTDVNTQACLLAAEYLFSGALPGQRQGRWYMTRAHHEETEHQIGYMVAWGKDIAQRLRKDEDFGKFALKRLKELNAALSLDPHAEREPFLKLAERQGWVPEALAGFAHAPQQEFTDRAIGIRSREACRLLAQDWILEPSDQVVRYRSARIAGKYMDLERLLKPTELDWEEIREESEIWRRYISLIVQGRQSKPKTDAALTADCDALALVTWGNRQTEGWNRRIVFVTGDRTLLDAARQRFVEDIQQRFLFVRPISYFAPVFNPTSANSQMAREAAFKRLQEVLEGAMVPLNLGLLAGENEWRRRARDDFALRVERAPESIVAILADFFPKARDPEWVAENEASLDALVAELSEIESLMLEAFPRLVAERLNKERERFLAEAVGAGTQALANAIDKRFESARSAGVQFSLQLMADALEEFLARTPDEGAASQRAAVEVRLSFSDNRNDPLDYSSMVAWLKAMSASDLHKRMDALVQHPERIFALVALLAFNLESWNDADRYADLAARAAEEGLAGDHDDKERLEHEYYEFLYLRAKSLRFRIAGTRPEIDLSYDDVWRDWMIAAETTLTQCIAHHRAAVEYARELRALSERAALSIAYCEWFAFGELAKLKPLEVAVADAGRALRKAAIDLKGCAKLASQAKVKKRAEDSISRQIILAARRQFNSNIHAARLTARRLAGLWPDLAELFEKIAARLPAPESIEWPNQPAIVDAYESADTGDWETLLNIATGDLSLELDIAVILGLQEAARQGQNLPESRTG